MENEATRQFEKELRKIKWTRNMWFGFMWILLIPVVIKISPLLGSFLPIEQELAEILVIVFLALVLSFVVDKSIFKHVTIRIKE